MIAVAPGSNVITPVKRSNQIVIRKAGPDMLPNPFGMLGFCGAVIHPASGNGWDMKQAVNALGQNYDWIGMQKLGEVNFGKSTGMLKLFPNDGCDDWVNSFKPGFTAAVGSEWSLVLNPFIQGEKVRIPDRVLNRMMGYFVPSSISQETFNSFMVTPASPATSATVSMRDLTPSSGDGSSVGSSSGGEMAALQAETTANKNAITNINKTLTNMASILEGLSEKINDGAAGKKRARE